MNKPQQGELYQHYKGDFYQVVRVEKGEPDLSETVVCLDIKTNETFVVPLSVFQGYARTSVISEVMISSDGQTIDASSLGGNQEKRFKKVIVDYGRKLIREESEA